MVPTNSARTNPVYDYVRTSLERLAEARRERRASAIQCRILETVLQHAETAKGYSLVERQQLEQLGGPINWFCA